MPGGTTDPVLAYGLFCGIKLAGYTLAATLLNRAYRPVRRNPFLVGGVRTLLGMALGIVLDGLRAALGEIPPTTGYLLYPVGIGVVRLGEWWLLLWLFYDRRFERPRLGWIAVILAALWSFALDAVGIWALFATRLVWIC